ncbi:MAG: hypothetical protein IKN63_04885 [Bacilli bacterium]|nr:hypothetical protein [Bacilli bacterium]
MIEPVLTKKKNLFIDKQKKILVFAVMAVVTLFVGSSYALLSNFDQTDDVVNISTGNLNMSVSNTKLTLSSRYPITDELGLSPATEPLSITLTNTGSLNIGEYDVKLIAESNKTSTLDYKYIKFSISNDNNNYSTPKTLEEVSNLIYRGFDLEKDKSITLYIKLWIDSLAGNYSLNKEFNGSISIDLLQKEILTLDDSIMSVIKNKESEGIKTYLTKKDYNNENIYYLSGDENKINFNYVSYSDHLWRIVGIYSDGTMKLVTADTLEDMAFDTNNKVDFYSANLDKSEIYRYLNETFLNTLDNYQKKLVMDGSKLWDATNRKKSDIMEDDSLNQEDMKIVYDTNQIMISTSDAAVGLLNSYEYDLTGEYLNNNKPWWTINHYNNEKVWVIGADEVSYEPTNSFGVRPAIYLKSGLKIIGSGTKSNPYIII